MMPLFLGCISHCNSFCTELIISCSYQLYLSPFFFLLYCFSLSSSISFYSTYCTFACGKLLPITSKSLLQTAEAYMTLQLLFFSNRSSLCPVSTKTSNLSFLYRLLFLFALLSFSNGSTKLCGRNDVMHTDRNPLTFLNYV